MPQHKKDNLVKLENLKKPIKVAKYHALIIKEEPPVPIKEYIEEEHAGILNEIIEDFVIVNDTDDRRRNKNKSGLKYRPVPKSGLIN